MQYARVPIELVELVDAGALQLYVLLCKYAGKGGRCWPSNAELCERTGKSDASIRRALQQLVDVGAVTRTGRQRRVLRVLPIESLSLTAERKSETSIAHPRAGYRSSVSDVTKPNELDSTPPLRVGVRDDESEQHMTQSDDALFEIERPQRELTVVAECMRAYFDAYGTQTISRPMIGRIGRRFKELADTYSRDELVTAAQQLGEQRIANPNAVEPFVLRLRNPQQQEAQRRSQWSTLAADTLSQMPSPFEQQQRHV